MAIIPVYNRVAGGVWLSETAYWVAFTGVYGIGMARAQKLATHFGSLANAWHADAFDLRSAGLDARAVGAILSSRKNRDPLEELAHIHEQGIQALAFSDDGYPDRLREIQNPPMVLYLRGALCPEDDWAVAIVGTRRASGYGKGVTSQLASQLAQNGVTVVSGLARGIDSTAHSASLDAGGRTIAILGSGVDQVYPWDNRHLAERIMVRGAIVSEYYPGTKPDARNFPPRNRIITGLSLGVLVVEADMKSGAMISAGFAAEQGKEVMAVPSNITSPSSSGVHYLIQQGAKLITSVDDILNELNLQKIALKREAREVIVSDPAERSLLAHLSPDPTHIDELARRVGLPIAEVSGTLTLMELKGMVRAVGSMQYVTS